ncbi:MAG: hypothetical protein QOF89_3194 [Acidobacteriota bacterium]|jgi:hypothetical protein|nr:hypothetical protein [Acidobacteriota bacterium]
MIIITQTMSDLRFNGEVKLGDLLTSVSLLIASMALVTAWIKERQTRRREYADKIRAAAAKTAVAVARRRELALAFYSEIQPLLTDTDTTLFETQNPTKARDTLWRGLVELRAKAILRVLDERVEEAYVGLYGYDTRIQTIYQLAMQLLADVDQAAYLATRRETQDRLFEVAQSAQQPYTSATLGNPLRGIAAQVVAALAAQSEVIVRSFQDQMVRLVKASDTDIMEHRVALEDLALRAATEDGEKERPTPGLKRMADATA